MSLALSNERTYALRGQLTIPSCDAHVLERELSVGHHPGFHIEEVDPMFITIYGGRQSISPPRVVQMFGFEQNWADRAIIEELGGRGLCRMLPGTFRNMLEEFWPIARSGMDRRISLACLFGSSIYQCDHMVTVIMGRKGYCITCPEYYPSQGRFDPNVWFALPLKI